MSTTIRDGYCPDTDDTKISADSSTVRLEVTHRTVDRLPAVAVLSRTEFLAAVTTELDVIVIDRADLPEVTVSPADGRIQARGATLHKGTATGGDALGWLAIDEHLKAHPPVDEAAVDALTEVCMAEGVADPHRTARRLVAAGVRVPQAGDDQ